MARRIPRKLYFSIGEVSELTGIKPYVLRYWESEFKLPRVEKDESGQRIYRRKDIETILQIKDLLYKDLYTIAGAKKALKRERLKPDLLKSFRKDLRSLLKILSK